MHRDETTFEGRLWQGRALVLPGKIRYCFTHNDRDGWRRHHVSSLYDDRAYDALDLRDKYLERSFAGPRLSNVTLPNGTRFWRRNTQVFSRCVVSREANRSDVHTAHIARYGQLLPKLKTIQTTRFLDDGAKDWACLLQLDDFQWETEKWMRCCRMRPDLYGSYRGPPRLRIIWQALQPDADPTCVCVEVVDKGPSSLEKLDKMLCFSRETGAMILIAPVVADDPAAYNPYFVLNARYGTLNAKIYIRDGLVHVNGRPDARLHDAAALAKLLTRLQHNQGYFPV